MEIVGRGFDLQPLRGSRLGVPASGYPGLEQPPGSVQAAKRGNTLRTSQLSKGVFSLFFTVNRPFARGQFGTDPIPSSSNMEVKAFSGPRVQSECSLWTGVTPWTASARRIVCMPATGRPKGLTFLNQVPHCPHHAFNRHAWVDAVLKEQIAGIDLESLD